MENTSRSLNAPVVSPLLLSRVPYAGRTAVLSALAGLGIAIVWSFSVADGLIGANIARTALGADARAVQLGGEMSLFGLFFAFVAGLAATFTACNCVVFSCAAPLLAEKGPQRISLLALMGWMALGITIVTAGYGILGALLGRQLPILSGAKLPIGSGYPVYLAQSTVVFVLLGIIFALWGLNSLGLIGNPFAGVARQRPWLTPLTLGLLVGTFTVGRPFPLFRKAFEHAAETGNPLFSATAMVLQGLGNIAVLLALLGVLNWLGGDRFARWVQRNITHTALITAASLIIGGTFFVAYWGFRVPSYFGIGWFPHMPYR